MTTVEFVDRGGNPVGSVTVTKGGELFADPWLESVVDTWAAKGRPAAEFAAFYNGWSNGHVSGRVAQPEKGAGMAAPLGSGDRFKALTKKLAARSDVSDPDAVAATIGRRKYGKTGMAQMAAAGRRKKTPGSNQS